MPPSSPRRSISTLRALGSLSSATPSNMSTSRLQEFSVNTNWAAANKGVTEKLIKVYNDSMAWLYDPKNRAEAVHILMKVSKINRDDVEKAYDFLIGGKYFEPTGKVSKKRLNRLVDALKTLGDLPQDFATERLFLPGVTQTSD